MALSAKLAACKARKVTTFTRWEVKMNGLHIPGTPLVVDYWRPKNLPPRLLFFLTHMHAGS